MVIHVHGQRLAFEFTDIRIVRLNARAIYPRSNPPFAFRATYVEFWVQLDTDSLKGDTERGSRRPASAQEIK